MYIVHEHIQYTLYIYTTKKILLFKFIGMDLLINWYKTEFLHLGIYMEVI